MDNYKTHAELLKAGVNKKGLGCISRAFFIKEPRHPDGSGFRTGRIIEANVPAVAKAAVILLRAAAGLARPATIRMTSLLFEIMAKTLIL